MSSWAPFVTICSYYSILAIIGQAGEDISPLIAGSPVAANPVEEVILSPAPTIEAPKAAPVAAPVAAVEAAEAPIEEAPVSAPEAPSTPSTPEADNGASEEVDKW